MADLNKIYNEQAEQYEKLVKYEDYEHNLLPAIQAIVPVQGLDILESGAGTGRLTKLLAPTARTMRVFDLASSMLDVAQRELHLMGGSRNWHLAAADHRALPAPDQCADLLITGWSVSMLVVNYPDAWEAEIAQTLREFQRVLRPGGTIIIIETQGTGAESPEGHMRLNPYYTYLEDQGFTYTWIRTDFQFESEAQAKALIGFFFSPDFAEKIVTKGALVPECTGIWWKRL